MHTQLNEEVLEYVLIQGVYFERAICFPVLISPCPSLSVARFSLSLVGYSRDCATDEKLNSFDLGIQYLHSQAFSFQLPSGPFPH